LTPAAPRNATADQTAVAAVEARFTIGSLLAAMDERSAIDYRI